MKKRGNNEKKTSKIGKIVSIKKSAKDNKKKELWMWS